MSSGTSVIQDALRKLGAYSVAHPLPPESIALGRDTLNSMIQEWRSKEIKMGCVPLDAPGDELSEPMDARNGIVENLAVRLYSDFPSISDKTLRELRIQAGNSYRFICSQYQDLPIPDRVVSSTTPLGAGNMRGRLTKVFAGPGKTVSN